MLADVIIHPDRFFAERSEEPLLLAPFIVVFVAAVTTVAGTIIVFTEITSAMPSEVQAFSTVILTFGALGSFLGTFLMWFLMAGAFHSISIIFDGEGDFRTVISLTGWGFVPAIVAGLISTFVAMFVYQSVIFPQDPQKLQLFVEQLKGRPELVTANVLRIVFYVWQGFVWVFAIRHARDLDLRDAAVTVFVPVLAVVVWTVLNLV